MRNEPRLDLRRAVEGLEHGWRIIADDVLALESRIDWVLADAEGRVILALHVPAGETAAQLGRALAHRAWVEARLPDWHKLAPERRLDPESPPLALLIAEDFDPEVRAAVGALPPGFVALARLRDTPTTGRGPRLERLAIGTPPRSGPEDRGRVAIFRSGLSSQDLGLTEDEEAEFGG